MRLKPNKDSSSVRAKVALVNDSHLSTLRRKRTNERLALVASRWRDPPWEKLWLWILAFPGVLWFSLHL